MADRYDANIDAFWDSRNGQAGATPVLDAELAAAIQQLHALYASSPPVSTRERVRQRVLLDPSSFATENAPDMNAIAVPALQPARPSPPIAREQARHRPSRWLALAAAVLIIFASLGGWWAYERLGGNESHPAVIPAAQDATPAPEATGWPQFRGGPARTGYSSDPGPGGDLQLRWTFTADEAMNAVISANDTVYAYGREGGLYAIDAVTGAQRWAVDLSSGEYSELNRYPTPAMDDGVLYTATFDGVIVALDADSGTLLWQRPIGDQAFTSAPVIADGVLYLVTPAGTLLALDPATGETLWESSDAIEFRDNAPAVGGNTVFVSDLSGDLIAIGAVDGVQQWAADLNQVNRVAAYRDGIVYVSGEDGKYRAVDATNGNLLWTSAPQSGQALNPLVTPNALIASNLEGPLQALDLATGEPIWSVPGPGTSASPHASSGAVYAVSPDLSAYVAYDLETGEELGRVTVDQVGSTAAISGNTLVLSSTADQGVVRSFGPGAGAPIEVTAGPATALPAATPVPEKPSASVATAAFDGSQVKLEWQSTGDQAAPLQYPAGLSIGPDGMLYLADQGLGPIQSFAPDGAVLEPWGEQGSGPGQFEAPTSIVFDNDGNRYVADLGNSRIQKFAPDGTFLLEWGSQGDANGQFSEPNIVAIDREAGRLYVTEFLNDRVQAFDLDGNFIDKWGSLGSGNGQFVHPAGISVNADGLVFVGDTNNGTGGRVQIFDAFGTWQGSLPDTFTEVWALAFDTAGNLYVADYWNNRIQVYDSNLVLIGTIEDVEGAGPFNHPTGLAFDADGDLYVSDLDNHRILKLQLPSAQ